MYVIIILAALAAWLIIAVAVAATNTEDAKETEDTLTIANEVPATEIVGGYENLVFPDRYDFEYENDPIPPPRKIMVCDLYGFDTIQTGKRLWRYHNHNHNNGRKPKTAAYNRHKARR